LKKVLTVLSFVHPQQVELSFQTGQIILVYGDMDEDGFYMGELDGIRGLVPSNFLADADAQGGPAAGAAQRGLNNRGRGGMMAGPGPGARGPPPPPRDMMGGMNQRKGMLIC
jgi:RIMS-binding protein 2